MDAAPEPAPAVLWERSGFVIVAREGAGRTTASIRGDECSA